MAILETDIKLLASERLTDDPDGGGFMTGVVVLDGVENNLFPDVSSLDRTLGALDLRKVFPAVLTATTDIFLGVHLFIDDAPADASVDCAIFVTGGAATERAAAVGVLEQFPWSGAGGAAIAWQLGAHGDVGDTYISGVPGGRVPGDLLDIAGNGLRALLRYTGGAPGQQFDISPPLTAKVTGGVDGVAHLIWNQGWKCYGIKSLSAAGSTNDLKIQVPGILTQVIPMVPNGEVPTTDPAIIGIDSTAYLSAGRGTAPVFHPNDVVVIHHTVTAAPQTVTAGQDINLGRTRLADVWVKGADGASITTGWAANMTTGHIVFSSVAGYSQPVTISNRIEDMRMLTKALFNGELTLNRGLSHDFPIGSKVSSAVLIGDLQAKAHEGFQQATWTSVWSDTQIGPAPLSDYNEPAHPIVMTNAGAITERWAVLFTSATSFRVIGEQVGEVVSSASGSTATSTAPLNPATGAPYFTIPSTGWGTGWSAGNVYRFNTDGANAPVWLMRSIEPSDAFSGQDKMTVAIRGNVDA